MGFFGSASDTSKIRVEFVAMDDGFTGLFVNRVVYGRFRPEGPWLLNSSLSDYQQAEALVVMSGYAIGLTDTDSAAARIARMREQRKNGEI